MTASRRSLLAAAALTALPGLSLAAPKPPKACRKRGKYEGAALRAPISEAQLDAAAKVCAGRLSPTISERFEDRFAEAMGKMKVQAATAALATADGAISTQSHAASGPAPKTFFWASVGKAYTATAILQLVEEGKLTLETPLDRFAADMPNAKLITVEDLLAHTSGLYSFQADPGLRAEPGYKPPERLLAAAKAQPFGFCPGGGWSYSNTGYVLAAQIISALDGKPYHEALKARIVDRLELTETTILAPRQQLAGLALPAASPEAGGTTDDVTTPQGAGAVAASAADVVRFWRALMANRLTRSEITRRRFAKLYPMTGVSPGFYGLGVMVTDLGLVDPRAGDTWIGHAGGLPGASATVAYSVEKQAVVAVALTGEGSPEATANLLLRDLPKAV